MPPPKEGKVFFILAVLIIVVGYQFLQGDNFLTGAGVAKTTADTTTTEKKATASNECCYVVAGLCFRCDTAEEDDRSSTTAKETTSPEAAKETTSMETGTETSTAPEEKTAVAGKAAADAETKSTTNQTTVTKTTTAEKEAVVLKEFTAKPIDGETLIKAGMSTPITTTKIVLENKGTVPLVLIPRVKEAPFSLPYEESLTRLVREKIQAEDKSISAQELSRIAEKKVAGIKAIEKAQVKPLYIRKIYRPLETITGQSVSDVTSTGQSTAGDLLSPQLLEVSAITVPPQEQATVDLAIREPLAVEEQTVDISFSSQGEEVVSSKLSFPKSKTGTAIDIHPERHLFDLYVVINPADMEKTGENYYVEIVLMKENKVTYFELLGPYIVKGTEPRLFSQEFRYPTQYAGEYVLIATIYRDTQRIIRQEHRVNLG